MLLHQHNANFFGDFFNPFWIRQDEGNMRNWANRQPLVAVVCNSDFAQTAKSEANRRISISLSRMLVKFDTGFPNMQISVLSRSTRRCKLQSKFRP